MFDRGEHPLEGLEFLETKSDWSALPADIQGQKLVINGHPVMEAWERPYMRRLAEIASSRGGQVLEVGFGLGISAGLLQEFGVEHHHIVEANEDVAAMAKTFAASARYPVTVSVGLWEDVTPQFPDGSYDGILYDTYPITRDELHTARFAFLEQAHRLLRPGGVFTHYLGEVEVTPQYRRLIEQAGFSSLDVVEVEVNPPPGTMYWEDDIMLAPIVRR